MILNAQIGGHLLKERTKRALTPHDDVKGCQSLPEEKLTGFQKILHPLALGQKRCQEKTKSLPRGRRSLGGREKFSPDDIADNLDTQTRAEFSHGLREGRTDRQ